MNSQPHSQRTDHRSASPDAALEEPGLGSASLATGGWHLYLTGDVHAVSTSGRATQSQLHGPQGRIVLASLALADGGVSSAELAERIWDGRRPRAWEGALRVVVHRVRRALRSVVPGGDPVAYHEGLYRLNLERAWIDVRVAESLIHHVDAGAPDGSRRAGLAHAAACITRRPFLPGVYGLWVENERRRLADLRRRALCRLGEAWLDRDDLGGALRVASEAFEADPTSARATLLLARAQLAEGEHVHAVRSIEVHDAAIRSFGVGPSSQVTALRERIAARPSRSNAAPTAE